MALQEQTSLASSFTIRELTGDQRTLRLAGRAAPHKGSVSFGGTQRLETTWYPGNPVGTRQVLGPQEKPTSARGNWSDRFVKSFTPTGQGVTPEAVAELDGQQLDDAMAIALLCDDIRKKGQVVEVTWDAIIRVGHLDDFTFTPLRREDIDWEMHFDWISQGDPEVPAVTSQQVDVSDVSGTWQNIGQQVAQDLENSPFPQVQAFADRLGALASALNSNIAQVGFAVQSAVDQATSPINSVRRLIGVMVSIQDSAGAVADLLTSTPSQTQFALLDAVGALPFANVCAAELWKRTLYGSTRTAQRTAAQQAQDLARQVDPDLIAAVVASEGQDLRDISTEFYGTPDQWKALEAFNGFPSSALHAGDIVFVPQSVTEDQ